MNIDISPPGIHGLACKKPQSWITKFSLKISYLIFIWNSVLCSDCTLPKGSLVLVILFILLLTPFYTFRCTLCFHRNEWQTFHVHPCMDKHTLDDCNPILTMHVYHFRTRAVWVWWQETNTWLFVTMPRSWLGCSWRLNRRWRHKWLANKRS